MIIILCASVALFCHGAAPLKSAADVPDTVRARAPSISMGVILTPVGPGDETGISAKIVHLMVQTKGSSSSRPRLGHASFAPKLTIACACAQRHGEGEHNAACDAAGTEDKYE